HAGNSSGIVDGSAAFLIGSKAMGVQLGLKPRARFVSFADIGSEPTIMLDGPGRSAKKAMKKAGMNSSDIDLWEINEAFAVVSLRFMQELGLDSSNVNVNGGSIAMGHPLGATGTIILGTALEELERTGKSTALASLCVGGGMATATIIERV
ncbi:MAG: acetyl-CoA C-acyltransferase, partial [Gammaproteobacteria bacterium]|nr:acetyl-CoA C-acyltransferase [Gammaproteobacteria bacterium]